MPRGEVSSRSRSFPDALPQRQGPAFQSGRGPDFAAYARCIEVVFTSHYWLGSNGQKEVG